MEYRLLKLCLLKQFIMFYYFDDYLFNEKKKKEIKFRFRYTSIRHIQIFNRYAQIFRHI